MPNVLDHAPEPFFALSQWIFHFAPFGRVPHDHHKTLCELSNANDGYGQCRSDWKLSLNAILAVAKCDGTKNLSKDAPTLEFLGVRAHHHSAIFPGKCGSC